MNKSTHLINSLPLLLPINKFRYTKKTMNNIRNTPTDITNQITPPSAFATLLTEEETGFLASEYFNAVEFGTEDLDIGDRPPFELNSSGASFNNRLLNGAFGPIPEIDEEMYIRYDPRAVENPDENDVDYWITENNQENDPGLLANSLALARERELQRARHNHTTRTTRAPNWHISEYGHPSFINDVERRTVRAPPGPAPVYVHGRNTTQRTSTLDGFDNYAHLGDLEPGLEERRKSWKGIREMFGVYDDDSNDENTTPE